MEYVGVKRAFLSLVSHISRRVDKKFYKPTPIQSFAIVVFESRQRFTEEDAREMGKGLIAACVQVGMQVQDTNPSIFYPNPQNGVVRVSIYRLPTLLLCLLWSRSSQTSVLSSDNRGTRPLPSSWSYCQKEHPTYIRPSNSECWIASYPTRNSTPFTASVTFM